MNNLKFRDSKLHLSWLRFLPYAAFGGFLFSLNSASNLSNISRNYLIIVGIELGIIIIYLGIIKLIKPNKVNQK